MDLCDDGKFFDVKPDVCDTCHAFGSFENAQPAFTTGVLCYVYKVNTTLIT